MTNMPTLTRDRPVVADVSICRNTPRASRDQSPLAVPALVKLPHALSACRDHCVTSTPLTCSDSGLAGLHITPRGGLRG